MREILFRGKRLDNGEWVEGDLWDGKSVMVFARDGFPGGPSWNEVDPSTVGQFTGLLANGKRIFEGDIVRQTFEKTNVIVSSDWGNDEYGDLYGEDVGAVVIIPSKGACIKNPLAFREVNGVITTCYERTKMYKNICSGRCEVIGNIYDNTELLEGGQA